MQLIHEIFSDVPQTELTVLLDSLQLQNRIYPKGALLLSQDDENGEIRILQKGKAHAVRYTADGREVDFAVLQDGDLFGDALAMSLGHRSPVNIYADCECTVYMFSYQRLFDCNNPYALLVAKKLAEEVAEKFFALQRRIHYITQPTLRDKIMVYLNDCKTNSTAEMFTIPFDRKELASFLCCERTALCRELSTLKAEGRIRYKKNVFCLL